MTLISYGCYTWRYQRLFIARRHGHYHIDNSLFDVEKNMMRKMTSPKRLQVKRILMLRATAISLTLTNSRTIIRLFVQPLWNSLCPLYVILMFRNCERSFLTSHFQIEAEIAPYTGTKMKQRLIMMMLMKAMTTQMMKEITNSNLISLLGKQSKYD